ncbi:hypothetical protein HDU85_007471 [Gaertneriomyces sp. JEL0708]|nr:hypothetical protein HDU85_007471 [Gaertneriomyces sp. JEL0708]
MNDSRGALIVVEGLDRSGKSTQTALLAQRLNDMNIPATLHRFPNRTTPTGTLISTYLSSSASSSNPMSDEVIHLLFSANRWEAVAVMKQALSTGQTLVIDRYAYSGVAYSASKGLDIEWCKSPDRGLPTPDLVIFLDLPPNDAAGRGGYGQERYEKLEFQLKVKHAFDQLREDCWKVIDATKSVEEIGDEMLKLAMHVKEKVKMEPLREALWL